LTNNNQYRLVRLTTTKVINYSPFIVSTQSCGLIKSSTSYRFLDEITSTFRVNVAKNTLDYVGTFR